MGVLFNLIRLSLINIKEKTEIFPLNKSIKLKQSFENICT